MFNLNMNLQFIFISFSGVKTEPYLNQSPFNPPPPQITISSYHWEVIRILMTILMQIYMLIQMLQQTESISQKQIQYFCQGLKTKTIILCVFRSPLTLFTVLKRNPRIPVTVIQPTCTDTQSIILFVNFTVNSVHIIIYVIAISTQITQLTHYHQERRSRNKVTPCVLLKY